MKTRTSRTTTLSSRISIRPMKFHFRSPATRDTARSITTGILIRDLIFQGTGGHVFNAFLTNGMQADLSYIAG